MSGDVLTELDLDAWDNDDDDDDNNNNNNTLK